MKKKRVFIFIAGILICAVCVIGGIFGFRYYQKQHTNTAEATFQSFVTALNHDDINGMLKYIEPTEAKAIEAVLEKAGDLTSSETIDALTKWLPFLHTVSNVDVFPDISPEIISVSEEEDTAIITISLENDTSSNLYDVHLIKIDDNWYIQYAWKSKLSKDGEAV